MISLLLILLISSCKLSINKENALIEILFKQNDLDIIEIKDLIGKTDLKLNRTYNLIKIPKEYANKVISFNFIFPVIFFH